MSDRNRFDKFTERSRKVLSLAQEEAQRFQHNYIGTEHILIALAREGEGVAASILVRRLGLTVGQLRRTTETLIGRGDRIILGEIGLTADAKQTIEKAVEEAHRFNHHYIGTEHLLLGLTHIPVAESKAGQILQYLGVSLDSINSSTMEVLSHVSAQRSSSPDQPPSSSWQQGYRSASQPQQIPYPTPNPDRLKIGSTVASLAQNPAFSPELLTVLGFAEEESKRFQHNYIGTEHLLLGLMHDTEGNATKVLNNLGVELDQVRAAVEFIIGRGDRIVLGEIGFTPRSKKVFELTSNFAYSLKSDTMKPEHLLLGLVYEGEGIACGVLESLGVERANVYRETLLVLGKE